MRIEIDGKTVTLKTLESETLVIARPTHRLTPERMKEFSAATFKLKDQFDRYGITVICANYGDVTFEVLKVLEDE